MAFKTKLACRPLGGLLISTAAQADNTVIPDSALVPSTYRSRNQGVRRLV
jgi:hypothetical protein